MNYLNHNTSSTRKLVADNVCYTLSYSSSNNRVYLTIKGFWKNNECVPLYLQDLKRTLSMAKEGFTILTDLRHMLTHPQEMKALHEAAHLLVMDAGVTRVAHVISEDKIANLQTNSIIQSSHLPVTDFTSVAEADAWLDEQE